MKNRLFKIIKFSIFGLFVVLSVITIVLMINRSKKVYYYMSYINEYYLSKESTKFNVNLYTTSKKDNFMNKELVSNVRLNDKTNDDSFSLNLINIVQTDEVVECDKKSFNKYIATLEMPISSNDCFQINDARLSFEYLSSDVLTFQIGNVIINQIDSEDMIQISYRKGIVNVIDHVSVLVGVGFTIKTNKSSIEIQNIKPLDERVNTEKFVLNCDDDYLNNESIDNLKNSSKVIEYPFTLEKDLETHYIIPLLYKDNLTVSTIGFIIEYSENDVFHKQIIQPFKYFNSSNLKYNILKYETS